MLKIVVLLPLLGLLSLVNHVHGHSVEVRHCLTTEGKLRVFLEHWHNDVVTNLDAAGTIDVAIEELNFFHTVEAFAPSGFVNNVRVERGEILPGCVGGGAPALTSRCSERTAEYDWVYFDFSFSCDIPSSYTILKGSGSTLEAGCGEVFPVTIVPAKAYCPDSPSAAPSISPAPSMYSEPSNCLAKNNPDPLSKSTCRSLGSRSACEAKKCIWFNSDKSCGTCEDLEKKNLCNSEKYCGWYRELPSAAPSGMPSISPAPSAPKGTCVSKIKDAFPSEVCKLLPNKDYCSRDCLGCVWFKSDNYCGSCTDLKGKQVCIKKGCKWIKY